MIKTLAELKAYFQTGDKPTQTEFENLIDSTYRGYKVYTALLNQTGTDAPVATVLENTLGGTVVWTRFSIGEYRGTLAGAFTENKTILPQFIALGGVQVTMVGSSGSKYYLSRINEDRMDIEIVNYDDAFIDWSDVSGVPFLLKIEVYN